MKRLLFVGGSLDGQMHNVPEGEDFEAPDSGDRYEQRSVGRSFPFMLAEGCRGDWLDVRSAADRFFQAEARRRIAGAI